MISQIFPPSLHQDDICFIEDDIIDSEELVISRLFRLHEKASSYFNKELYHQASPLFQKGCDMIQKRLPHSATTCDNDVDSSSSLDSCQRLSKRRRIRKRKTYLPHFTKQTQTLDVSSGDLPPQLKSFFPRLIDLPKDFDLTFQQLFYVFYYNKASTLSIITLLSQDMTRMPSADEIFEQYSQLRHCLDLWKKLYGLQWRIDLRLRPVHTLACLTNLAFISQLLGEANASRHYYNNLERAIVVLRVGRKHKVLYGDYFMATACSMLQETIHIATAA